MWIDFPLSPSFFLSPVISSPNETRGTAIKSMKHILEMAFKSEASSAVMIGKLPCLPWVNLMLACDLTDPPILTSILTPCSVTPVTIATTLPSSMYALSLGLRYRWISSLLMRKVSPSDAYSNWPDCNKISLFFLSLSMPVFSLTWDILISLPLSSTMRAQFIYGLSLLAYLNLLINCKFSFCVPWLRLILAADIPASSSFTILCISLVAGLLIIVKWIKDE